MASYYFAPAPEGKSTNAGTSAAAPLDYPGSFVGKTFTSGDRVFLKSGTTHKGTIYFGTAPTDDVQITAIGTNPVIFDVYGGLGRATVVGDRGDGWQFADCHGVEVNNINFAGTSGSGWGFSFYASNDVATTWDHFKLSNSEVYGWNTGVMFYASDTTLPKMSNITFDNVEAHNNLRDGIVSSGVYDATSASQTFLTLTATRCRAHHNYGDPLFTDSHSGNGIVFGQVLNGMIDRCTAWENGGSDAGSSGPVGIWFWNSKNSTIQRSISYNNHRGAGVPYDGNGLGFDVDCQGCTLQYNLAFGNEGNGLYIFNGNASTAAGHVVRFNVAFLNNSRPSAQNSGELLCAGALSGMLVYNNTLIARGGANQSALTFSPISFGSSYTGVRVANNIIAAVANGAPTAWISDAAAVGSVLLQNNDYWRPDGSAAIKWGATTYATLATFRTGAGATQEQVSGSNVGFVVDPKADRTQWSDVFSIETCGSGSLPAASPLGTGAINIATVLGSSPGARDFSNQVLRATNGSVGAQQEALLALNTAQNPNLVQMLVAADDGSLFDYQAQKSGAVIASAGKQRAAAKAMKNASGQSYVTET